METWDSTQEIDKSMFAKLVLQSQCENAEE